MSRCAAAFGALLLVSALTTSSAATSQDEREDLVVEAYREGLLTERLHIATRDEVPFGPSCVLRRAQDGERFRSFECAVLAPNCRDLARDPKGSWTYTCPRGLAGPPLTTFRVPVTPWSSERIIGIADTQFVIRTGKGLLRRFTSTGEYSYGSSWSHAKSTSKSIPIVDSTAVDDGCRVVTGGFLVCDAFGTQFYTRVACGTDQMGTVTATLSVFRQAAELRHELTCRPPLPMGAPEDATSGATRTAAVVDLGF
jgi:hypothetical protein